MNTSSLATLAQKEYRTASILMCLILLGWGFLAWAVVDMSHPLARLMMPINAQWSLGNLLAVFLMWGIMMTAMMLPSAAPMILTFINLSRQNRLKTHASLFVAAYLVIWVGFSMVATALHWGLQATGLLTPMMVSSSIGLTAILLLLAGLFQFTRLKETCLRHCRTPMGYLLTEWQNGTLGAWRMGLKHGFICLCCCWALMGLLFVTGVMDLIWVAALSVVVLIEKIHPAGAIVSKLLGSILIVLAILQALPLLLD